MNAMILCAGFGTRLRPLTEELPKPLVPIGGEPLLGRILHELSAYGTKVINVHHLADELSNSIRVLNATIQVSSEPKILGTAGGIAAARPLFSPGPLLVWNGDIWTRCPPPELVALAEESGVCMLAFSREAGRGTLGMGKEGELVRIRGETFGTETSSADYMGIVAIAASALRTLPAHGCLIADWILPRLRRGQKVRVLTSENRWWDIGTLAGYLKANLSFAEQYANAHFDSFVHPKARVEEGVRLRRSVVAAAAEVVGRGDVVDSVIWPGARIEAPLNSAVVTRRRVVTVSM